MKNIIRKWTPTLLLMPLAIWLICFGILPLIYGGWLSFHNATIENLLHPKFSGFQNYKYLFMDFSTVQMTNDQS